MVPPLFDRAVSFGVYEGSMRAVIHAFKYDRMAAASKKLGKLLARAIEQLASDDGLLKEMMVVPVPLHRRRMSQRGFNQARALAVETLKNLKRSHPQWKLELSPQILVRQRTTDSQAGLTPRQRRLNLRGAFFVPESASIRGRNILLVDDIYTTGATARACSKVLIEGGASSVSVATLARAQRRVPLGPREKRKYLQISGSNNVEEPVHEVSGVSTIHESASVMRERKRFK